MHKLLLFFSLLSMACNGQPTAGTTPENKDQPDTPAPATRRVEILDPEANQFFDATTTIDVIRGGFVWTEGPLYIKSDRPLKKNRHLLNITFQRLFAGLLLHRHTTYQSKCP